MTKKKSQSAVLGPAAMDYLSEGGRRVFCPEGETIVRRGEPGKAFYVILRGTAEVRLLDEGGRYFPLLSMEEGDFFGEMSLITGDPVSADVVALTDTEVLAYPAGKFQAALVECEPLRTQVMRGIVSKLRGTTTDAWNFFQKAETLHLLREARLRPGPLIDRSPKMARAAKRVPELARTGKPLLIRGRAGTGKTFAASKIHEAGRGADAPFIVVDCSSLVEEEAESFIFGSVGPGLVAEKRESVDDELHRYGALHLAQEGTLVVRQADSLPGGAQRRLVWYLDQIDRKELTYPVARIIVTCREDPARLAEQGSFDRDLAARLRGGELLLPSLAERRPDILPLARQFLEESSGGRDIRFHPSAEHALASHRYRHRNAAELREAVETAVLFSHDGEVRGEHVFTGPKEEGSPLEYEIGQIPLVKALVGPKAVRALSSVVFLLFGGIIFTSLALGESPAGRAANALTWGLWEPSLILLFFLLGRVWCTFCPLSTAGRLAGRLKSLDLPPPDLLKKNTGLIIAAAFLLIVWAEHAFDMFHTPRATGILLASLMAAAILFALLFQRESWCRYACPLGNIGAVFSFAGILNVRANPNVCSTCCRTHNCFKGSETEEGCPVFHHPLYIRDAHHCKLCFRCLRTCPHGSAKLYLRPPLQTLWRQSDFGGALVPFALLFFIFTPATLSWPAAPGRSPALWLGFSAAGSLLLAYLIQLSFSRRLFRASDDDPGLPKRLAFGLMVLAWGPAMAYQLKHVPGLGSLRIHLAGGTPFLEALYPGGLSLLTVAQAGAVATAGLLAAVTFRAIRVRTAKEGSEISSRGWTALAALCAGYFLLSAWLVLRGVPGP